MTAQKGPVSDVSRKRRILWIIVSAALMMSLISCYAHRGDSALTMRGGDDQAYHELALRIMNHQDYGTTHWVPGYPCFVAAVFAVAGEHRVAVYVVQSILFAITLLVLYKIALLVFESQSHAIWSVALAAAWPEFYRYVSLMSSEMLSGLLLAITVWLLLLCIAKPTGRRCVALGIMVALASLVKSTILPYTLVCAALIALGNKVTLKRCALGLLTLVVACAVVSPWAIRNYRIYHAFIPMTINTGWVLYQGFCPGFFDSRIDLTPEHFKSPFAGAVHTTATRIVGKTELEVDRMYERLAMRYIKQNPVRDLDYMGRKFGTLWLAGLGMNPASQTTPMRSIGRFGIPKRSLVALPAFILSVAGVIMLPCRLRRRSLPIVILVIMWTVIYVCTYSNSRYAVPVQAYILMCASVPICRVAGRRSADESVDVQNAV